MTMSIEKSITLDFIEIYRSEPCLWMKNHKDYRNKNAKEKAYCRLITKLQETDLQTNRQKVIAKISNLRKNYWKQLRKIEEYENSTHESFCGQTLWYFRKLDFINDQEKFQEFDNKSEEEDSITTDSEMQESHFSTDSATSQSSSTIGLPVNTSQNPSKESKQNYTSEVLSAVKEPFKRPKKPKNQDRFDAFGNNVTMKLRDLEKNQRILAEKLINDILFEAEMGNLKQSHKIVNMDFNDPLVILEHTDNPEVDYQARLLTSLENW